MNTESFPRNQEAREDKLAEILREHGNTKIKNPHYGRPGHDNDPAVMLISETPEKCPPFIEALLRAQDHEQLQAIIDVYRDEQ